MQPYLYLKVGYISQKWFIFYTINAIGADSHNSARFWGGGVASTAINNRIIDPGKYFAIQIQDFVVALGLNQFKESLAIQGDHAEHLPRLFKQTQATSGCDARH
jgi:hypothetical protein